MPLLSPLNRFGATITVAAPLKFAHELGAQVSGTGITLKAALKQAHARGARVIGQRSHAGNPQPVLQALARVPSRQWRCTQEQMSTGWSVADQRGSSQV